jgi:tetratricopeptide (TPR) repeat protein
MYPTQASKLGVEMRLVLFVLLFCHAVLAWAGPEEDAQKQMEKGAKAFTQNKLSDAALAFNRALEILPEAAGPHRELGKCYQKLNEPDRAIHHYTQYLTKRPDAQERKTLEAILLEIRKKLPTEGRALLSLEASPGATVYVLAASGEMQGIGVSPLSNHPVDPRFTVLRLITPSKEIKERALDLKPSLELLLRETDFNTPESQPIRTTPLRPEAKPEALLSSLPVVDAALVLPTKPSTGPALAALGVASAGAVGGVVSGVFFFKATREIQAKLDSLNNASIDEKIVTTQELQDLDQKALTLLRVAQLSSGVAIASAVVGVVLLRKINKAKVEASIGVAHVTISASF